MNTFDEILKIQNAISEIYGEYDLTVERRETEKSFIGNRESARVCLVGSKLGEAQIRVQVNFEIEEVSDDTDN